MVNWDVVLGAFLAFAAGLIAEAITRHLDRRDKARHAKALLSFVLIEVQEGVHRCESLVSMLKERKLSPTRIYTAVWDSTRPELSQYVQSAKIPADVLALLHRLYYRFDLVNFNMEADRFGKGEVFASEYLADMQLCLRKLEDILGRYGIPASPEPHKTKWHVRRRRDTA